MGLFKPKGLGKKVKCMRCGKTYYLAGTQDTSIPGVTIQSFPKAIPGYTLSAVAVCTSCGKVACTSGCYHRGCTCGNNRFDPTAAFYKN